MFFPGFPRRMARTEEGFLVHKGKRRERALRSLITFSPLGTACLNFLSLPSPRSAPGKTRSLVKYHSHFLSTRDFFPVNICPSLMDYGLRKRYSARDRKGQRTLYESCCRFQFERRAIKRRLMKEEAASMTRPGEGYSK